jgi:hypothetical protein
MPAMAMNLPQINANLDQLRCSQQEAFTLVTGATDLGLAATQVGAFKGVPAADAAVLQTMLSSLPPSVQATIIAAVTSAGSRGVPIVFSWTQSSGITVSVHESGVLTVLLQTPPIG